MSTVMIKNRITLNELETLLTFIMQLVIETFYFQHRPTSQVSKFQTLRCCILVMFKQAAATLGRFGVSFRDELLTITSSRQADDWSSCCSFG